MFEIPIENIFNPVLLFWISFFYLVILFHSFGIGKIWDRINGVELLFLSAVIGYIYYNASISLIFPLIDFIKKLIGLIPTQIPSFISILNLQINYTEIASFFVFLFVSILIATISYFIVIFSMYAVIKILEFCLDPQNDIFPYYQRFIFLQKNQIPKTVVFRIPYFLFVIGIICIGLGALVNSVQNIVISSDIWVLINTFLQIIIFFACIFIIYLYLQIGKDQGIPIFDLIKTAVSGVFNYFDGFTKKKTIPKPDLLTSFFLKHIRLIILFIAFCLLLFVLLQNNQGVISFFEILFWLILIILAVILSALPEEWIDKIRERIELEIFKGIDSKKREEEILPERKNDPDLIDAPLEDLNKDQFLRTNFTHGIAQTIVNRKDPSSFVIGIYGEWGEGKTSVLNFIKRELENNPEIICVKYNPWRYKDEPQLLLNFFFTLSDALEKSLSNNQEKIGKWIGKYATILSPISVGVGGFLEVSPGGILSNAGKAFSSVELDELKIRIENILEEEQKKVVVFIDDIDRLDRQEIQMLLKIVKLSADFKHTIYVLALDEEMVAAALSEKYATGNAEKITNESGKKFLEKIIQIPLHLPKINPVILRDMCYNGIADILKREQISLNDDDKQQFAYHFNQGFITRLKTPRLVKRYLNALSFSFPLMKNKINTSDLMLLEAIRIFYPHHFLTIRKNPDVFLGSEFNSIRTNETIKSEYLNILDPELEKLDNFDKGNLKETLLYIFPRLKTLYSNTNYAQEWNITWDKQQKIASKRYLDRYFAYTFPKGDISEQDVKNFIENLDKLDDTQIFEEINRFVTNSQSANIFIIELRKNLNLIIPDHRNDIAFILSQNSYQFPYTDQVIGISPFSQLAIFLREILLSISDYDARLSLSKSICENSEPYTFGFEFIHWIDVYSRKENEKKIIVDTDFEQLIQILISRVKESLKDSIFFIEYPEFASRIFNYWSTYGSKNEIESFLSKTFESGTDNTIAFLKCYITKSWGTNGPLRGNLIRETYNQIIGYCDPSIIYNSLEKKYGDELKTTNYTEDEEIDLDRQIANQFAYLYLHTEESEIEEYEIMPLDSQEANEITLKNPEKKDFEKEEKIVKYLGKTIFSPIKGIIESDRDFFKRGYNIVRFHQNRELNRENERVLTNSPNDYLKKIVHDPDIILKKHLYMIQKRCDQYDNYSKKLEAINTKIFNQKNAIWVQFRDLCDSLNPEKKFPNESDYFNVLALTIADAKNAGNPIMYSFFDQYRAQLRSFIMQSSMKDVVDEYTILRDDFMDFSTKFLKLLADLFHEWQRKYSLEESELVQQFSENMV
jgi:predicted KAP-like P-loop ATPase